MKIAIDITYSPSGGSLIQIVKMLEIFNQIEKLDIIIYSKKSNDHLLSDLTKNNKVVISKLSNLSIIGRIIWGQLFLPFHLMNEKADVLFCPGNFGPIYSPVKTVIWIHTIGPFFKNFIKHFFWISKGQNRIKLYMNRFFMSVSAKKADAIIFESHFTKDLFKRKYNIKENKSHVINIGFDEHFANNKKLETNILNTKAYNKSRYILCVSHLYPYKNIVRLLIAFKEVLDTTKTSVKLMIAGSRNYSHYNDEINNCICNLNIKENVVFLGDVKRENLKNLYLNARVLVFPSPFENFPYTLIEAMSCGTPVVCSNTTAMPETCQDAALYFDPYNTQDMASKISLILENSLLRKKMSKKAIIRAKKLPSFNEVTDRTLKIMRDLIKNQ